MQQTLLEYTDELRRLGFAYKNICRRHECDELLKRYPCSSWLFVSLSDSYFDFVELWIVPLHKVEKRLLDGSSVLNNIIKLENCIATVSIERCLKNPTTIEYG